VHETYRGKSRHAISARQSTPTAFAQAPARTKEIVYHVRCVDNKKEAEYTRVIDPVDTENRIIAKYRYFG
jgi:hypothetical protein